MLRWTTVLLFYTSCSFVVVVALDSSWLINSRLVFVVGSWRLQVYAATLGMPKGTHTHRAGSAGGGRQRSSGMRVEHCFFLLTGGPLSAFFVLKIRFSHSLVL